MRGWLLLVVVHGGGCACGAISRPAPPIGPVDGGIDSGAGSDARPPGEDGGIGIDAGAVDAGPCPGRLRRCDGECVDISGDTRHCGGCGDACDPAAAVECRRGQCVCGDSPPCAGTAEDTCCPTDGSAECTGLVGVLSHWNCGGCGVACADDEYCGEGVCTECDQGVAACGADGLPACPGPCLCIVGCCTWCAD